VLGKTGSLESLYPGDRESLETLYLEDHWSHCVRIDRGSLESLC